MEYWKKNVIIGGQAYPRFIGGPLDGYTDSPFRQLVRTFSGLTTRGLITSPKNLLYTQMRHVATIARAKGRVHELDFVNNERPLQFQIATNSTRDVARAVERIISRGVDGIDLNIACPAKNVIRAYAGSALMADLPLLERVLRLIRLHCSMPLTVKMRAGFKTKNALEVARVVQECGVDALAIHPRLQTQRFGGDLDYGLVNSIKAAIKIPVLYSGGIVTFADAKMVYERTGVDAFLIGRALCAAPWKLAELEAQSQSAVYTISPQQHAETALRHLALLMAYYGPTGLYHFRKFIPWYIAGFDRAAEVRKRIMILQSADQVVREIREFFGV